MLIICLIYVPTFNIHFDFDVLLHRRSAGNSVSQFTAGQGALSCSHLTLLTSFRGTAVAVP